MEDEESKLIRIHEEAMMGIVVLSQNSRGMEMRGKRGMISVSVFQSL